MAQVQDNVYIPLFTNIRDTLDEHHARRESITKASRDITASAKKMIFALHRSSTPDSIPKALKPHELVIRTSLRVALDNMPAAEQSDAWRYKSQLSPGIQELVEALLFRTWLMQGTVMTWEQTALSIQSLFSSEAEENPGQKREVLLLHEDYVLGMLDFTGEVMKWCITDIAKSGHVKAETEQEPKITYSSGLQILRDITAAISTISLRKSHFSSELSRKMEVMHSSMNKVENAVYSLAVRGAERTNMDKKSESVVPLEYLK
jgi:predicted translin family RNA/ssDNA-binding protein